MSLTTTTHESAAPTTGSRPPSAALFAGPRTLGVLLILGPVAEIVEAALSPLSGGSTADDLTAIAAHQQAFLVSVLFGLVGTLLYLPGFLGLMQECRARSPRWARVTAWLIVLSISCFVGLRATQGTELALARSGLPVAQAAGVLDRGWQSPIGALIFVLFLGGAFLGLTAMCVTTWRAGFPRPAALLLALFQPLDLALDGRHGTLLSHGVLLVALVWIAISLWQGTRRPPRRH